MNQKSKKTPVVVAISGGGRTLKNLLAMEKKFNSYQIVGVIASRPNCKGMNIARENSLPIFVADFAHGGEDTSNQLSQWLTSLKTEWILLGGFLKKFPTLDSFKNKVVNIHPALLPKYGGHGMYGSRVHKAVIDAKEKHSGASIHFVNEEYDEGDVIAQIKVDISKGETPESLAEKVFDGECVLYPKAIDLLINKKLPLKNKIEEINYES